MLVTRNGREFCSESFNIFDAMFVVYIRLEEEVVVTLVAPTKKYVAETR